MNCSNCSTVAGLKNVSFNMRAFWRVFFGDLLAGLMNYSYLCTVNEKRRILRPNWATKIT